MTTKEYLQQIYKLNRKVHRLQLQRDTLKASMYEVESSAGKLDGDWIKGAGADDPMVRAITRLHEAETDMAGEITTLVNTMEHIADQIEQLEDERYKTILHERYVCCYKWQDIAEHMHTDLRYVYRLHGHALQAFRDRFDHCFTTIVL